MWFNNEFLGKVVNNISFSIPPFQKKISNVYIFDLYAIRWPM